MRPSPACEATDRDRTAQAENRTSAGIGGVDGIGSSWRAGRGGLRFRGRAGMDVR